MGALCIFCNRRIGKGHIGLISKVCKDYDDHRRKCKEFYRTSVEAFSVFMPF